jgi:hypothetical protein
MTSLMIHDVDKQLSHIQELLARSEAMDKQIFAEQRKMADLCAQISTLEQALRKRQAKKRKHEEASAEKRWK